MPPIRTGEWTCNCERYCRGTKTPVSRATYYNHAPYRPQLGSSLAPILRDVPATGNVDVSNHPQIAPVNFLQTSSGTSSAIEIRPPPHSTTPPAPNMLETQNTEPSTSCLQDEPPQTELDENYEQFNDNAQPIDLDLPQVPQPLAQDLLHREAVLGQELAGIDFVPCTEELKMALAFARALEEADLENGDLTTAQLSRLQNPIKEVVEINDHDTLLSLKLFLSTSNSSEHVYKSVREDLNESNPDQDILSLEAVKKKIESITGVSPLDHHMCPDSCIAY
ncbi:hypothetical protein BJ912DRAFT_885511, partial [Pholiota molesta]